MADSVATKHSKQLVELWNDSAAKEAYENAQKWCRGNCIDRPSNIQLSSPDALLSYIDEVWNGFNSRKKLEKARDEEDYTEKYTNKHKNIEKKASYGHGGSHVDNYRRKHGDGFMQSLFRQSTSRGPRDHGQKHRWWRRNTGRRYVRANNDPSEN